MKERTRRMGELIQRELADLISRELNARELGMVTVSGVDVSPDLTNAKVFFTVIGGEWNHTETRSYLQERAPQLRHILAKRLTTRITPKLNFYFDHSLENGLRLDALLHGLHPQARNSGVS